MDTEPQPEFQEPRTLPAWLERLKRSPRALGLVVTLAILATLGIGALADTLATAPLRPATRLTTTQQAGIYGLKLSVSPEPLKAGARTTFAMQVTDATGAAVENAQVVCNFTMPAMPMPLMLVTARSGSSVGIYTCQETLTSPGAWALTVTLTPRGRSAAHTTFALQAS